MVTACDVQALQAIGVDREGFVFENVESEFEFAHRGSFEFGSALVVRVVFSTQKAESRVVI